jgi:hypothetical protein
VSDGAAQPTSVLTDLLGGLLSGAPPAAGDSDGLDVCAALAAAADDLGPLTVLPS